MKQNGNQFDVTMGSYDGAEICELVGLQGDQHPAGVHFMVFYGLKMAILWLFYGFEIGLLW